MSDPKKPLRDLVAKYNQVLSKTLTQYKLRGVPAADGSDGFFDIAFYPMGNDTQRIAIPVGKGLWLWVWQRVWIEDGECHVLRYRYTIQSEEANRRSALIRWQFHRAKPNKDFGFVHSHVHAHGTTSDGIDLTPIHIPTDRISLELVIWHLLTDWKSRGVCPVKPGGEDWQRVLIDSEENFRSAKHHKGLPIAEFNEDETSKETPPRSKTPKKLGRHRRK